MNLMRQKQRNFTIKSQSYYAAILGPRRIKCPICGRFGAALAHRDKGRNVVKHTGNKGAGSYRETSYCYYGGAAV